MTATFPLEDRTNEARSASPRFDAAYEVGVHFVPAPEARAATLTSAVFPFTLPPTEQV